MDYLDELADLARAAGAAILEIYQGDDLGVETKKDASPLTLADLAAHRIILDKLRQLAPALPVLSEESEEVPYERRRQWRRYFLVDPLDGTKEFINRNGEFTVNIALIDEGMPVQGVVYAPAKDILYAGKRQASGKPSDSNAYMISNGKRTAISARPIQQPLAVVASRRHGTDKLQACLALLEQSFPEVQLTSMGSSFKLCLIAEGKADIYPRLAPTSEWDTAAAQAIVEAAGGLVVDEQFQPLRYNTKDSLLNPCFYVLGDPSFDWASTLASQRINSAQSS